MLELFYGCIVLIALISAVYSASEVVIKSALLLFAGWVLYVSAEASASFADRVIFNLYLDCAQLAFMGLLYLATVSDRKVSVCAWLMLCFVSMIALHIAELKQLIPLRTYYMACNGLFLLQLTIVMVYSFLPVKRVKSGDDDSRTEDKCQTTALMNESRHLKIVSIRKKSM